MEVVPSAEVLGAESHGAVRSTLRTRSSPQIRLSHHRNARLAAASAAALLAGLLVIGDPLDVLREPLLLTHLLEPPQHLFGGLVAAQLHFDHSESSSAKKHLFRKHDRRGDAFRFLRRTSS